MARLVPQIVVEFHAAEVVLPAPDDFEVLVEMEETAGRVALGITEHRNNDIRAEAVDRMRRRQIRLGLDLVATDDLVHFRVCRV